MKLIDATKLVEIYQRLSQREKIIFYFSAALVLIVAADQLVLSPILRSVRSLDQKVQDTEDNIKRSIRLLGQKERMMKEAEHYATYAAAPKSAEDETLVLLKQVQALASETSVNLLYSKPAGGEAKERNIYRVNLECEGQMEQLINFFYAIENSKLLLRIEKYSLQPAAKGSSVVKCAAVVSMAGIP